MNKIVGVCPEENTKTEENITENGLLSEIYSAQKRLERKIDKLNILKQRLYSGVVDTNSYITSA